MTWRYGSIVCHKRENHRETFQEFVLSLASHLVADLGKKQELSKNKYACEAM